MRDDNCIFCKIANGDIPSKAIYEDDLFKVILDLGPATRGHALILPKDHAKNLFERPDDTAKQVLILAKKLGKQMVEKLNADGLNIIQNNGEAAGQTVFHLHMHIIPRYYSDDISIRWNQGKSDTDSLAELAKSIGQRLK